jgi:signal peptidase I
VTDAIDDAPGAVVATRAAGPLVGPRPATHVRRRGRHRGAIEWVVVIIVALAIAAGLKTFVVEAFKIPSGSMEPTIQIGDRVLVDKLSYKFGRHPHAGDIVVFTKPPTFYDPGVNDLIKRVIGTPGESLRTGAGGQIYVNGKPLAQPWLSASARANPGPPICSQDHTDCDGAVLHLPAGDYLVMGDNRDNSDDGRYFGPIPGHLIVGRAVVRIWPLGRIHFF